MHHPKPSLVRCVEAPLQPTAFQLLTVVRPRPFARSQGLAAFYEKRQRWGDYAWSLQELMQLFLDV